MRIRDHRIHSAVLIAIVGTIVAAGCGSGGNPTKPLPTPTHSSHFHEVSIENFAFSPTPLHIAVADTVLWTNNDSMTHTVTSDTGDELGGTLNAGRTYQHIFTAAGSFAYHCTVHPSMHGSVVVQ